ncbi:MAG TPA: 2TM domain-containing protein [Gemmataceae bacterium]|nr:2TM domain-containing protein [Gemmataceae bacterium]
MLEQGTPAGTQAVARRKAGLYIHATVYAAVNVLLITINLSTGTGRLWFQWPLLGWGIGLLAHAAAAFSLAGRQGTRRRIRKERRRLRRERRDGALAGARP